MAKLYLIATPIGNLEDITLRALEVLKKVDIVLSEKPLITKRLFARYEISIPLRKLNERAQESDFTRVIDDLRNNKNIAYVSEAGTPGISDPGGKLVQRVLDALGNNVEIIPVPGASALTSLLSVSGINVNRFLFLGFLPKKKKRKKFLTMIVESELPVVVYESVHRIRKFLLELIDLGVEEIILGRELTKKFETIYRGHPKSVLEELEAGKMKGEFVVIINR
ncbi:16S rRNA (cytidine(1402)-2'-O)-methyltransferase [bacterium]|nr:MAG: 16S rRNA (cytidine(1402)-2'-O)-methyltransferase [bacterium]